MKRLLMLVAALVIAGASVTAASAAQEYSYLGTRWMMHPRSSARTVRLDSARLRARHAHAAVWFGVSNYSLAAWVQGGVEFSHGERYPHAYIEIGHNRRQTQLLTWRVRWHQEVRVRIVRHRRRFQIVVTVGTRNYASVFVAVRYAHVCSTLELLSKATATAHVGLREVGGTTL